MKRQRANGAYRPLIQDTGPKRIGPFDVFHIIRQRWKWGAIVGVPAAVLLAAGLMSQESRYSAEAKLLVELNADNIVNVQEVVETDVQNSNMLVAAMNTHVERLKSRSMAQAVVDSLSDEQKEALIESIAGPREEWEPGARPPDPAAWLVRESLKLTWLPQSLVIRIEVRSTDADLAQVLANQYAKTYQLSVEGIRGDATDHAVSFLATQTAELQDRIEQGERALQDYRREHNLLSIEENQRIIAEKLSQLNHALTEARVRLLTVNARLEQVRKAGNDIRALVSIPYVGSRPHVMLTYNEVEQLRREKAILEESFLKNHPSIQENEAALAAAEEVLWNAVEIAKDELTIDKQITSMEVAQLSGELQAVEAEALHLDQLAIDYRILVRDLEADRLTFDHLARRLNETGLSQELSLTTIKILDMARLPQKPVWPDPKKVGIASTLLFGIFLVALPLGLEFSDKRLRTFEDIETQLGRPVLGDILYRRGKDPELASAVLARDEKLSEPFQIIYSSLKLQLDTFRRPHTLIVTSSLPREGKTFVASNLAETFSAHRLKTVLVDCDWRRPSVHRCHGISNDAGALHWIRSEAPLAENLLDDPRLGLVPREGSRNFFLLPSGGSTRQAADILDEERLGTLIARLKREFDILILDTPPLGLFPDAALLADYADHTVFVARQNKVTRQRARGAIQTMAQTRAPVAGVVFNAVKDPRLAAGYGSYLGVYQGSDYSRYRKYYKQKKRRKTNPVPALAPGLETS